MFENIINDKYFICLNIYSNYHFFQAHYRKFLVSNRTDAYDLHQSLDMPLEQFKISDAIKLCANAWKEVTSETIKNCWLKTGILPILDDNMEIETSDMNNQLIQEEYCELQDLINGLNNIEVSDRLSAEDFIRIDNEIQEVENVEITEEEIISYVRSTTESESEDESSIVKQKITTEDALKSLDTILSYIQNPGSTGISQGNNHDRPQ
jgi:hypothetical protein